MKSKLWILLNFILVAIPLAAIGFSVVEVDPFFHYHPPKLQKYYYQLDNQRSMNNGILKHFDYDALITGSSMTENFNTTEMDERFGTHSIKVPFSGATFKEINDNIALALNSQPTLKTVVRCLDTARFFDDSMLMREDLGTFPTYLYDKNPLNDVQYIFNRDVIFSRVYPMRKEAKAAGFEPGIESFDSYSNWMRGCTFGSHLFRDVNTNASSAPASNPLSESEKSVVTANIKQNVVALAEEHPDVTFYYYFSPYSIIYWNDLATTGTINRQVEAEQIVIEEILKCKNIKLFSFNNRTDIITDLNNYKDFLHYGEWVNSLILYWMQSGQYLLTEQNYKEYLSRELAFYTDYAYEDLARQPDYECDAYAAALVQKELHGVDPYPLSELDLQHARLQSAALVSDQFNHSAGIVCAGNLPEPQNAPPDESLQNEYVGAALTLDVTNYNYLTFYGKQEKGKSQSSVVIYDESSKVVGSFEQSLTEADDAWHMNCIDLRGINGTVTIVFSGGAADKTVSVDSSYIFSNIVLY